MYGAKRSGAPPMMASMSGSPYRAVRTTDCGEPPTPTQGQMALQAQAGRKVRHASFGASGMAFSDIRSFSSHPAFDLVALQHENEFSIPHQPDGRGRWRIAFEIIPGVICCLDVGTCEHGNDPVGQRLVS